MLSNATVSLVRTTIIRDQYGDATSTTARILLPWAVMAPRTSSERSDPRAPAVVTAATLYGPVDPAPGPADLVEVSGHSAALDGTWQVEGMAGAWVSPFGGPVAGAEVALVRAGVS